MKISEKYQSEKFHVLLITAMQKFLGDHINVAMENKDIDYKTYGSPKEKKLKLIIRLVSRINTVLGDLDKTFIFLAKDRKLISEHYPEFETQKEYYNYHFENFYIRLTTLLDIIGKLGNEVYDLGLKEEKVSAYIFKDRAKSKGFEKISLITGNLIEKIDEYRKARHSKLHTGESEFEVFKGIVFWEDLMKISGNKAEPILNKHTDEEIKKQLDGLKGFAFEVVELIENFMDEASLRLKEYINEKNE